MLLGPKLSPCISEKILLCRSRWMPWSSEESRSSTTVPGKPLSWERCSWEHPRLHLWRGMF